MATSPSRAHLLRGDRFFTTGTLEPLFMSFALCLFFKFIVVIIVDFAGDGRRKRLLSPATWNLIRTAGLPSSNRTKVVSLFYFFCLSMVFYEYTLHVHCSCVLDIAGCYRNVVTICI